MFTADKIKPCFKNLLGWKSHYDTDEIPALPTSLTDSLTGEYFQDFHPAMRLDLISACLPPNRDLEEYLIEQTENGIVQLLNDVITERQLAEYARKTLATETLLQGYGWAKDTIVNESRFVGFRITLSNQVGLKVSVKKIGFQFSMAQTDLDIYVYHSSRMEKVTSFKVNSTKAMDWIWVEEELELLAENEDYSGGSFVIGYYQDDIVGQAINFTGWNWKTGPCGSCDGGVQKQHYTEFQKYASILPVYVPEPAQMDNRDMFDMRDSIVDYDKSYGMNIRVTAECDLTNFFCEHKYSLKKGLALKVVWLLLKDMQFSQQINNIEENLKMMIIRDLEGDKDTNYINIVDQLKDEIKAINFDHSKLSQPCLPCRNSHAPTYGVI